MILADSMTVELFHGFWTSQPRV